MEKEILEILVRIESKVDRLETRMENLETRVDGLENKLNGVVEQTANLVEFRNEILYKVDGIKEDIAKLKAIK